MRIQFEPPAKGLGSTSASADLRCEVLVTNPDGSMQAFETVSDRVVEVAPSNLNARLVMADAARNLRSRRVRSAVTAGLGWFAFAGVMAVLIAVMTGFMQLRVIASGSMAGTYEIGDVVVVLGQDTVNPENGDVIVFHYYNISRSEIIGEFCHRIVGGTADSGFVTQGDANLEPDVSPVLTDDVIGVVVGHIPNLGWVLQPQWLIAALTILVIIALVGPVIPTGKGRSRG
jgi:signal peptidase